jgi:DNA-binding response OmpR family regulator
VAQVLLATDADWILDQVAAALAGGGTTVSRVKEGRDVLTAVNEIDPDLVILDLQVGSMGGVATCLDLRHESGMDRISHQKVLLLLDRQADTFLAKEAGADGWLVKPLDAVRLAKAADTIGSGEQYFE